MPYKNTIRVAEFEKLYYDDTKPFKKKHWEALCNYQEKQNRAGGKAFEYFKPFNKGVQFTNYVGVIQAGNLTIEVLPKTDRERATASNLRVDDLQKQDSDQRLTWHNVLLKMLNECRLLQVNHVDYASLNLKNNSILEIYLELFLVETEKLLHEGLVKKYRKTEGNKLAMKGQLLFAKSIGQNLVHRERFYIRYTEYNRTNIFNQLLYKTICLIPSITTHTWLADKVNKLLLDFPEMPDCKVSAETFEKLVFDRKTERYKEALLISKMLLLNYRPDITGGSENVIAILFDMNKLWEEFVYRRLKKEESCSDIIVKRQQSANFWRPLHANRSKTVRPDIVIEKQGKSTVIDTKWKIMDDIIPDDNDLKQMFVYNLFWECDKSILLYPAVKELSGNGEYHDFRNEQDYYTTCSIETVNILDSNQLLDKSFGEKVLKAIFR